MKLFLTSAGFTNNKISQKFLQQLSLPITANRILIIAYAKNPKEESCLNESKKEIELLGFTDVVIANMANDIDVAKLGNFAAIYVCGGNTFSILNKMRETKLDNFIIDQVEGGAIYVGVSAGSIIAGPEIKIAGWGSEGDENEIGLRDLTGLKFVNIAIFPHFCPELTVEVEEFRSKVEYQVIELTNDQAVFVDGTRVVKIGHL